MESKVTRSGAWRRRCRTDSGDATVAETECLYFVDAEISRGDIAACAVEDDRVRVWRLLARLVRTAPAVLDLAADWTKPAVGSDRQHHKVPSDIVANDQMMPSRIHRQMRRNRAAHGLTVQQSQHAGLWIDGVRFGRSVFLPLIVVDLVDDVQEPVRRVERKKRRIGAVHLLHGREPAVRGIELEDRDPHRIVAAAAGRVFGVRSDIDEGGPRCIGGLRCRRQHRANEAGSHEVTPVDSKRREIARFDAHCLLFPPVARHVH